MTYRVFVDSSAFIAAIYSARGYSYGLLLLGIRGEIEIVLSMDVVNEIIQNITIDRPDKIPALERVFAAADSEMVDISRKEVRAAAKYIVEKDAPILAAAKVAEVDMLVSLDKRHILEKPELVKYIHAPIVTPAEAVRRFRASK